MNTYLLKIRGDFPSKTIDDIKALYNDERKFAQKRGDRIVYSALYNTGVNLSKMASDAEKTASPVMDFVDKVRHFVKHEVDNAERLAPVSSQYIMMSLPMFLRGTQEELDIGFECEEDDFLHYASEIEADIISLNGLIKDRTASQIKLNGFRKMDEDYIHCISSYRQHLDAPYPLDYAGWRREYRKDEAKNKAEVDR